MIFSKCLHAILFIMFITQTYRADILKTHFATIVSLYKTPYNEYSNFLSSLLPTELKNKEQHVLELSYHLCSVFSRLAVQTTLQHNITHEGGDPDDIQCPHSQERILIDKLYEALSIECNPRFPGRIYQKIHWALNAKHKAMERQFAIQSTLQTCTPILHDIVHHIIMKYT